VLKYHGVPPYETTQQYVKMVQIEACHRRVWTSCAEAVASAKGAEAKLQQPEGAVDRHKAARAARTVDSLAHWREYGLHRAESLPNPAHRQRGVIGHH
jgi:hypothetical protein